MFKDKTLLITGGTGSFGNAVLDGFLDSDLKEIRVFSRDEKKQHDMRLKYNSPKIKFYVGDVRDETSVSNAMIGVDMVFHAAALKQVPSCEFYPMEAVKTNILGTENVLNSAIKHKVSKVVCLSTDKAVMPVNAMGMTKALMEKLVISKSRTNSHSETTMCITRYGNVMASRGSVIPVFVDQIKEGRPLTITDPSMTRFLMPLSEAIDLVLFAYEHGRHGDTIVQKTEACTVELLAKALLEIFDSKSEIKIIGTRHGEKKHESLMNSEELSKAEDLGNYYRVSPDDRDLNYELYFSQGKTEEIPVNYASNNTHQLSLEEVKAKLLALPYIQSELKN